jgi:hypothetical protein
MQARQPAILLSSLAFFAVVTTSGAAQTTVVPPEPPTSGGLAAVGAWIAQWLPVVGSASYPAIEETGDFLGRSSDSVTAALLEGCTLVLHERSATTVRTALVERRHAVRIPLDQVDTIGVEPKIRRPGMLLGGPHVMVTGQLVIPLRSPTRARFITIVPLDEPGRDSLAVEHLIPLQFAMVPATRSARAIRRAAAICVASSQRRDEWAPLDPPRVFGF